MYPFSDILTLNMELNRSREAALQEDYIRFNRHGRSNFLKSLPELEIKRLVSDYEVVTIAIVNSIHSLFYNQELPIY
jgi:hypothetical protein